MATVPIKDISALMEFAKALAAQLEAGKLKKILMRGPLGCGKTTLASAIVCSMPGADNCEPASPSFNICNVYPARPEIIHCDLYRCGAAIPEDALEDILDPETCAIVEWAEFLPEKPAQYLDIDFEIEQNLRLINIQWTGMEGINIEGILPCGKAE